jgi:hypothetical protein
LIFADILDPMCYETGAFMLNSSVFIFLMLCALYRMIYENEKSFFCKNSLNVPNVKLFSMFLALLCIFAENDLLLYILSDFPCLRNLSSLNDLNSLNNLSGLNDL